MNQPSFMGDSLTVPGWPSSTCSTHNERFTTHTLIAGTHLVNIDHLAVDRGIDIGGSLDGLNRSEGGSGGVLGAHRGKVNEDNISQRISSKLSDTDSSDITVDLQDRSN